MNDLPLIIRPGEEADRDFIFSSWMNSYRKGSRSAKALDRTVYTRGQKQLIEALLRRSDVLVAANPDVPEQIFGYVVFTELDDATAIHWIYVKEAFRRLGYGSELFAATIEGSDHDINGKVYATHTNHNFPWISEKWRLTENPYLIYEVIA